METQNLSKTVMLAEEMDMAATDVQTPETGAVRASEDPFKSLGAAALRGTIWNVVAYGGAMGVRLLSNIILTRLLVPQYFGLMTLLNTTIVGFHLISDIGLTPNIIRSDRGDDPDFLNTAWTMQVIRGCFLWIACLLLAVPFAQFYREPQFKVMMPLIGLSLVISSFNSTSLATFSRRIAVRELALVEFSIQVAQFAFTVAWALVDRSVWALIAGRLFSDVARLIVSHRLIPGQRNAFRWDKEAAHELLVFGRWVFVSTALTFLSSQSDRMILGRLVSFRTLGLYGVAFALSDIPRQVILTFSGNVVLPVVAKLTSLPRAEFLAVVLKYRRPVLFAAAGFLAVIIAFGDRFMGIYDARYQEATWIVPVLAIGLWHTLLYSTSSPCLFALGKPQYMVAGYFFTALTIFGLMPLAFYKWGLLGAVWVVAFSDVPSYFTVLYGMKREQVFPLKQDLKATVFFVLVAAGLIGLRVALGVHFPRVIALH